MCEKVLSKSHFFALKKRAITHFQSVRLPNSATTRAVLLVLYNNKSCTVLYCTTTSPVLYCTVQQQVLYFSVLYNNKSCIVQQQSADLHHHLFVIHRGQGWAIAHSLIAHFRFFQKSDSAIACSIALYKRANVQSLFLLLFAKERSFFLSLLWKERMYNRSFFRSFHKSDKKSDCSFTLSKIEQFSNLLIFRSKKEQSLILKMTEWQGLAFGECQNLHTVHS